MFKPPLKIYDLAIDALRVKPDEIAFVSSNRWDVAGAANRGLKPIWVNRGGNPDEYPGLDPVAVIRNLAEVADLSL
jgi:2-haloacid dehalogenase